jgi:hypothetical protein
MRLLLLATLLLFTVGCHKPLTLQGYILNQNIYNGRTLITFESETDKSHPFPLKLYGEHPELWQGEHVRLTIIYNDGPDCYTVDDYQKLD